MGVTNAAAHYQPTVLLHAQLLCCSGRMFRGRRSQLNDGESCFSHQLVRVHCVLHVVAHTARVALQLPCTGVPLFHTL